MFYKLVNVNEELPVIFENKRLVDLMEAPSHLGGPIAPSNYLAKTTPAYRRFLESCTSASASCTSTGYIPVLVQYSERYSFTVILHSVGTLFIFK